MKMKVNVQENQNKSEIKYEKRFKLQSNDREMKIKNYLHLK